VLARHCLLGSCNYLRLLIIFHFALAGYSSPVSSRARVVAHLSAEQGEYEETGAGSESSCQESSILQAERQATQAQDVPVGSWVVVSVTGIVVALCVACQCYQPGHECPAFAGDRQSDRTDSNTARNGVIKSTLCAND